ncbi:MAG TPA: hypothetical protein VJ962_04040 [Clostridia bacterium]|nr:hypothetical protein [Clostridia bacterium]
MSNEIYRLKNLLYDLEYYIQRNRHSDISKSTQEIRKICDEIDNEYATDEISLEVEESSQKEKCFQIINVLDFIYIPFNYKMQDDNIYIKNFSKRRFENLKEASVLSDHNKFWSQHETIDGNIYGSVPIELLNAKKVALLEKSGWDKVSVEILDFKCSDLNQKQIKQYCKENLYRYIIIREKETSEILVLNYNLNIDGVYK